MVVDDVEEDGERARVAGIDEALEGIGRAVRFMRGEEVDAVVAPALDSGEGVDGHQLDVGDAEVAEIVEFGLRGVEGAFGGEGADVQFIKDGGGERRGFPGGVGPREGGVIEKAGGAVDAAGLPGGAGIGEGEVLVVEKIGIVHAGARGFDVSLPPAAVVLLERVHLSGDLDADLAGVRRPEAKAMHADELSSK